MYWLLALPVACIPQPVMVVAESTPKAEGLNSLDGLMTPSSRFEGIWR